MLYRVLFTAVLLLSNFLFITAPNYSNPVPGTKTTNLNIITYERVFIDGLWWIIEIEDGVKVRQYVDPNQF